ncbi:Aspartate-semialdehyde dehydrogenase [Hondaea fermentalgiana]|uniref:aspartate-semialdehyde dehydrogenase n=1 Tax=Hondaea fermentalgiana TaxID=2315210 RepID=A0A2R5GD20_9STRA|nr:Aspartate-semialdehyde dehydrogenase [Hondaea fermentalgiana]|eukprot:GBG28890.1 Aspartate-semialdehyde dehydrogenase [Hondaea fermentalgiana]
MRVGIVGCTGAVGEELVKVLGERQDRLGGVTQLKLLASAKSAGKVMDAGVFGPLTVEEFSIDKVKKLDVVFLAVSGSFSLKYAHEIAKSGPVVIDNSSAFRNDPEIPLVIPEINGHTAKNAKLIANPNCTTAIAAMALWPLHQKFGIRSLIMSTYQAASGAGAEGMAELEAQTRAHVKGSAPEVSVFQYPLAFNVIPHVDSFQPNGYTREEMKVVWETRKIFGVPDMDVSCTAVRIPTLRAHAEALTIQTWAPCSVEKAKALIDEAVGVQLVDDPSSNKYPMPINATAKFDVEAGRVRQSIVFGDFGLDLFVCGDQLLRGAALNAVLIAEFLHEDKFEKPSGYKPTVLQRFMGASLSGPALWFTVGAVAATAAAATSFLTADSKPTSSSA